MIQLQEFQYLCGSKDLLICQLPQLLDVLLVGQWLVLILILGAILGCFLILMFWAAHYD